MSARAAQVACCIALAVWLGSVAPSAAQEAGADVTQRYERARALGNSGATEAALAEFDALLAAHPNDADYLLGRAQMLARLGQTAAAIETAERALALAPSYEDVWQLRLQLAERTGDAAAAAALRADVAARFPQATWWQRPAAPVAYRRWLSGGYGAEQLSNDAPNWGREFLRLDWQTTAGAALFGELSSSERFDEADDALSAGASFKVSAAWRVAAGLAVTDDARFLPDRELSLDATRAWPGGWGATFGVRARDYATGDVTSYTLSGEKYIADFRIAYRLDRARLVGADSASTHALALTWYGSERRSLGVTLGTGEEIETIGLGQLLRTSISNLTLTGNEMLASRVALNWWLGTHEQGDFYRRDYAGLSVRVGF